jgi:hypothetical protein
MPVLARCHTCGTFETFGGKTYKAYRRAPVWAGGHSGHQVEVKEIDYTTEFALRAAPHGSDRLWTPGVQRRLELLRELVSLAEYLEEARFRLYKFLASASDRKQAHSPNIDLPAILQAIESTCGELQRIKMYPKVRKPKTKGNPSFDGLGSVVA